MMCPSRMKLRSLMRPRLLMIFMFRMRFLALMRFRSLKRFQSRRRLPALLRFLSLKKSWSLMRFLSPVTKLQIMSLPVLKSSRQRNKQRDHAPGRNLLRRLKHDSGNLKRFTGQQLTGWLSRLRNSRSSLPDKCRRSRR